MQFVRCDMGALRQSMGEKAVEPGGILYEYFIFIFILDKYSGAAKYLSRSAAGIRKKWPLFAYRFGGARL